jgi:hypothetical protein
MNNVDPINTAQITRGVNVYISTMKRMKKPMGFVMLSKKRVAELELLKSSPFYQSMTLVTSRDDKNLFKTILASDDDRAKFVIEAVEAAHAVGVGTPNTQDVSIIKKQKNIVKTV